MSKKVALMCGHGRCTDGSWDCGTSYGGNNEAALMLPITKAAVKYLRSYGVKVISDADKNNNRNMIADVAWANKQKCDIYVSLHCDYYRSPSGTLPLFVSAKGKKLATAMNKAVMKALGMKTRGVCRRTDLYELNCTDMPACIFETGSIKADIKTLKKKPDTYGKAIAKGICDYLGIKAEKPAKTTTPKPTTTPTAEKPKTETAKKKVTETKEDKILNACKEQLACMKTAKYGWESKPTIEKSKKKGTCVTYVACVLQRLGALKSGQALWHNGRGYGTGKVTGANSKMDVKYMGNKSLSSLKDKLKAGDIILLDDNKSGIKGSGGHIFILKGTWAGNDPYVYDQEPNRKCIKTQKARKYSGNRKVLARVRLK